MQRGKFIVIEGLEGAGKSTATEALAAYLRCNGVSNLLLTREPGGTPLAEQLRQLIKDPELKEKVDSKTELLLMYAARVQLVSNVIRPHLEKGGWVICDRFFYSTLAYQGGGRGVPLEDIWMLNGLCLGHFRPDLVIYMDIDPAVGLQRAGLRGELDRFELEKMSFFEKIRKVYLDLLKSRSEMVLVDASRDAESVVAAVVQQARVHLLGES